MTDFVSLFNLLSNLSQEAAEDLYKCLSAKVFDKGELLLRNGETCKKLYFIDEGLTKTFFTKDDKEFIMRFFPEKTLFTVVNSFELQAPSSYEIMTLEKTSVTYILKPALQALPHCNAIS